MNLNNWIIDENKNKIHSTVLIGENVILGKNNLIYPYTVIGLPGAIRDLKKSTGKIIIGDNNNIGNNVSIMSGKNGITEIGNDNIIMNYVNIGHDSKIGNNNEIGVRTIIAGYCEIGNNNMIKLDCTLRNRISIGNDNLIGMGSVVTKNFKLHNWIIYGNPARQIKIKVNESTLHTNNIQ